MFIPHGVGYSPGVEFFAISECAIIMLIHEITFPRSVTAVIWDEGRLDVKTRHEPVKVIR